MYQLYSSPYSQHCRRVIALLEENNIPYTIRNVDMANGEYLAPHFLAINPNHQVPALLDGDIRIFESNAILRYLSRKHQLDQWYPQDLASLATIEQWLDWNQCQLAPLVGQIVMNRLFLGDQGSPALVEQGIEALQARWIILDDALSSNDCIAGSKPTIADLSLASNLTQLEMADVQPESPRIQQWYQRIAALKGFQAASRDLPN